jgi:hypothetical protein
VGEGGAQRRMRGELKSPLAGEGGERSEPDEGELKNSLPRRFVNLKKNALDCGGGSGWGQQNAV